MFFAPTETDAGLLSSMFGSEVSASTSTNISNATLNNSVLDPRTIIIPIFKDKKTSKDNKNKVLVLNDNNDNTNIMSNALFSATSSLGVTDGTEDIDYSDDQVSVYVIRPKDTILGIAHMYGVSVNTILLANDMKKGDKLVEGDVLFILPVSGIEYVVKPKDTLRSIARDKKVDISDIALYNGISEDAKLVIGDKLTLPGADDMADEGGDKPAPNLNKSIAIDKNYYAIHPLQNLLGYFVNPVPAGHKTQGLHGPGHRGIDIGAPTGTEIYSSAEGRVLAVKTGCKLKQRRCGGGYGNMVIIQHPNGTKTLSAHMSTVATTIGTQVAQGEVIGYVGSTGKSTGPHIHFEVFSAKNPGSDWSWANQMVAATANN